MAEGIMNLNLHWYDQPTIFDRLNEQQISWKIYAGDAPLSLLFVHQWEPQNAARYRLMTEFYRDVASFKKGGDPADQNLPQFTFIEPSYCQPGANDAHPPHDILAADALVANVYNAIRANEDLWEQTLLVVAFDEHGGFYDHLTPPHAVPPDFHQEEYTFDQFGVRVPVILVSPWVDKAVFRDPMDHTSLLKYLRGKWSLCPLGHRTQLIGCLELMAEEDANVVAARAPQVLSGPQSQIDAAIDRFESFLKVRSK
jgi:phospholipase C